MRPYTVFELNFFLNVQKNITKYIRKFGDKYIYSRGFSLKHDKQSVLRIRTFFLQDPDPTLLDVRIQIRLNIIVPSQKFHLFKNRKTPMIWRNFTNVWKLGYSRVFIENM